MASVRQPTSAVSAAEARSAAALLSRLTTSFPLGAREVERGAIPRATTPRTTTRHTTPRTTTPPKTSRKPHRSASDTQHSDALPPVVGPVLNPFRRFGQTLTTVTGWSAFSGPLGWLLTGLLVLALTMIGSSLTMGRVGILLHRLTRALKRAKPKGA